MSLSRFTFIFLAISISLSSCYQRSSAWGNGSTLPQNSYELFHRSDTDNEEEIDGYLEERMIIYTASMGVTVENPDSSLKRISDMAIAYGGYVESVSELYITVRVPMASLESSMNSTAQMGKLDYSRMDAQDVTDNYTDRTIRLENAESARARYLTLLEKANTVEEILLVEKELERLNTTIDLLKGEVAGIEERVALASLTVSLSERKKLGLLGYVGKGVYHAMKWLFVRN